MNATDLHRKLPNRSLWNTRELAGFLGCSERHVYTLRKRGLPAVRVGGLVRFDPATVRQWLSDAVRPAPSTPPGSRND